MSKIDDKRNELEKFIQEQMIGPGGCAWRFSKTGLDDGEEVLNTTPGSVYNTAILFPKKDTHNHIVQQSTNDNEQIETDSDILGGGGTDDRDKDNGNTDNDDAFTLERRFPNAMAISCCLRESVNLNQDVRIRITGRYYRKITGEDRRNVYILIPEDRINLIEEFRNQNEIIRNSFCLNEGRLSCSNTLRHADYDNVSIQIKEINRQCARTIREQVMAQEWGENVLNQIREEHLLLSTCRRRIFDKLSNTNTGLQYRDVIQDMINNIGLHEQALQDMTDLLELYGGRGYGFWESKPIYWTVDLSHIPFSSQRRSFIPSQEQCDSLKNIIEASDNGSEMSLSVLLQITKDFRNADNHKKYLKVMLQNSTTPFVETQQDHFTIVNEKLNKLCFFGMKIELESDFIEPYQKGNSYTDVNKEEDRLKFVYRDVKDYGVGHLCSVDWDKTNHNKVWSEFLPTQDIPDVDYTPRNKRAEWVRQDNEIVPPPFLENNNCLNLNRLSTFSQATDHQIREDLLSFVGKYQEWINLLPDSNDQDANYESFARYTMDQCQNDCDRIRTNIETILGDDSNMHSFRLMNSAMLMQMWHNKQNYAHIQGAITPDFYSNKGLEYNWRPFQLAFILMNIDGIIQRVDDHAWDQRNKFVDLVWFPTGGGKTEAYLGIIALTIINRRRKYGMHAGGTTAIMRYTLRLLATQQFERALKLILALDQIRIWGNNANYQDYNIGTDAVSIGLFVGQSSLPNSYSDLDIKANAWNDRNQPNHVPTNIPLDKCPWCGQPLTWSPRCGGTRYNYRTFQNQFNCINDSCTFNRHRIPVQLCDDQIYSDPPTLLFGTVDKFAQLARKVRVRRADENRSFAECIKNDSRRLFGTGDGIDFLTPDLIIQDELHLLLGPLGSAVSLFEAAIDQLCTRSITVNGRDVIVRPKIISSTATTRNTELQIRALYDRNVNIFPKSGVDYDDSFFAFYKQHRVGDNKDWISKRRYMGIMPTGRTQMLMQLRLAAILFVHRAKFEKEHLSENEYNAAADNYFSVISYFNSLKEVGKTDAQYPYEFTKYLQRLYQRVMGHCGLLDCFYADENTLSKEELTGRLSGPGVVSALKNVEQGFSMERRLPHIEQVDNNDVVVPGKTPPDYILATNMISVGIDVDRFNTIIMNSMPRNTAEYIQASSRVARKYKGLVLTSHNPFRVRDVSHYERFKEFHEKMYYYVDPISITPFSSKAVEKYLPLYLATIIRHKFSNLQNNRYDACNINNRREEVINAIMTYFNDRIQNTQNIINPDAELQEQLRNIFSDVNVVNSFVTDAISQWEQLAQTPDLWYYNDNPNQRHENVLFTEIEDYEDTRDESNWTVPNSLRIVEPEAVLKIKNLYEL